MERETLEAVSVLAASLAALAAIFSGICAFLSYRLSSALWNELKSDERLLASEPIHPRLQYQAHSQSVLQLTLFNKSKRKVFLTSIQVKSDKGEPIEVDWSDSIDNGGNPIAPGQIVGIVDSAQIFIRKRDGQPLNFAHIEVHHSFDDSPTTIEFDKYRDFGTDSEE